jgi:hypothetical protein
LNLRYTGGYVIGVTTLRQEPDLSASGYVSPPHSLRTDVADPRTHGLLTLEQDDTGFTPLANSRNRCYPELSTFESHNLERDNDRRRGGEMRTQVVDL